MKADDMKIRTVIVEHSLVDLAMAYLRGDDANPDVGMGMFPAVAARSYTFLSGGVPSSRSQR